MNATRSRRHAMTLVEVLVGIGVGAVVMGAAYQIAAGAMDIWGDQQARSRASNLGWLWLSKVSKELRMAVPASREAKLHGRHAETPMMVAMGLKEDELTEQQTQWLEGKRVSNDVIRFPTVRVGDRTGQERPGVIQYAIEDEDGSRLLKRRTAPLGGEPEEEVVRAEGAQIISVGFSYLDADGKWQGGWAASSAFPEAVRITVGVLTPARGEGIAALKRIMWFSTVVYLPVTGRVSP